jgi:uncharacterized protein
MTEIKHSAELIYNNTDFCNHKQALQDNYVSGYASVFDIQDSQRDIIKKGAFSQVVENFSQGKPIPLLWQHMSDKPIGVIEKIEEDNYGLYIVAKITPNIRCGMEALELIKSRVICSFSIGYTPTEHFIDYDRDIRIIKTIDLWEISLVTFPANQYSNITSFY